MASLVDTNILVYRFDPRFPAKQDRATALLRQGIADESIVVPHQALIEFVAAVTRPIARGAALLAPQDRTRTSVVSTPFGPRISSVGEPTVG